MLHRVLVYGTLKRSQPNHYLILEPPGQCTYIGRAKTVDQWPLVVAGMFRIPYLLDVKGTGKHVHGEVFELDDEKLEVLDRLERHPKFYTRTPIQVTMLTGSDDKPISTQCDPVTVEVYIIHNPKKFLLDLTMLSDYDNNNPVCGGYILPKDRKSGNWELTDIKELE